MTYQKIIFLFQRTHSSQKKKTKKNPSKCAEETFHKAGEHFT